MEIPGYVYAEQKPDKPAKNIPDPGCVDHGCDATSYGVRTIYETDFANTLKTVRRSDPVPSLHSRAVQEMSPSEFAKLVDKHDL
jgi:hypothetical protein